MINMVFGLAGSGKSTALAWVCSRALKSKKYDRIYSNFPLSGCYEFRVLEDLYKFELNNCLILFDEATLTYDNRDFKKFPREAVQAICLHRHFITDLSKSCDIWLCAQEYDAVDKKLRMLTQNLYYCRSFLGFSYLAPIYRHITISPDSSEIVYGYKFGSWREYQVFLRSRHYWRFDSFEKPSRQALPADSYLNSKYPEITKSPPKMFRYIAKLTKQLKEKTIKKCRVYPKKEVL